MIYCETRLEFQSGTSDKEYVARVENHGSYYEVICFYGRRGSTLKQTSKGTWPVGNIRPALAVFEKVVREKTGKGYWIVEEISGRDEVKVPTPTPETVEEVIKISDSLRSTEDERQKAIERLRKACAS
jgi:hypothetical protein